MLTNLFQSFLLLESRYPRSLNIPTIFQSKIQGWRNYQRLNLKEEISYGFGNCLVHGVADLVKISRYLKELNKEKRLKFWNNH